MSASLKVVSEDLKPEYTKAPAIERLSRERPYLRERRYGLPDIGRRYDGEQFNPAVQGIADAIDFYGFKVRDKDIVAIPEMMKILMKKDCLFITSHFRYLRQCCLIRLSISFQILKM